MELNIETRAALLDGSQFGFVGVSQAPEWAANRIAEIRHAIVEKRAVPAPSREYVRAAEQRSLANRTFTRGLLSSLRRGQSLQDLYHEQTGREFRPFGPAPSVRKTNAAPTVRGRESLEQIAKRNGIPVAQMEAAELRRRLNKAGAEIAAYNLPTGPMTADEREAMKRRLDVAAGLRAPERFPWEL
jgi:hypothetical protein